MPLYHNVAKSGFYYLGGKHDETRCKLTFDSAKFVKSDDLYTLYAHIIDASDVVDFKDKSWQFTPNVYQVRFNPNESKFDKWLEQHLTKVVRWDKLVEGFISIDYNPSIFNILESQDFDDSTKAKLLDGVIRLTETTNNLLGDIESKSGSKSSGSYKPVPKFSETFKDKTECLSSFLVGEGIKDASLGELALALQTIRTQIGEREYEDAKYILSLLMGK